MSSPLRSISAFIVAGLFAASLPATALAAEFVIPPGSLQLVEFESEAPVENIRGLSTEAKGQVTLDLADPSSAKARVSIPVASLRTGNTTRDEDLRGKMWLDAAGHPDIAFTVDAVALDSKGPLAPGAVTTGRVKGQLSIRGTSRAFDIPIKLAYLAASDKLKKAYIPGNALRIKGEFPVVLADFGVKPPDHILGVKVADTVSIRFALTALEQ